MRRDDAVRMDAQTPHARTGMVGRGDTSGWTAVSGSRAATRRKEERASAGSDEGRVRRTRGHPEAGPYVRH